MALLLVSEACSGSGLGTLESIPNGRDWGAGQEGLRKIAHESIINTMTSGINGMAQINVRISPNMTFTFFFLLPNVIPGK